MSYSLYGTAGMRAATIDQLKAENKESGLLFARAENSGCEGCYVEVAKWNEERRRWERYAFEKYFGGEHPDDTDAAGVYGYAADTAQRFADDINAAANPHGENVSFIHSLPDYGERPAWLDTLKEIVGLSEIDSDTIELALLALSRIRSAALRQLPKGGAQ